MSTILHFGPGNFFRAHLAEYTFDAGGWDITAVSLRSSSFRDALDPAKGYFLAIQGQGPRQIDVIKQVLVAPEDPARVLASVADPDVAVISATVTEKGYYLGADGRLDVTAPDIAAELAGHPTTVIGFLAHGLARRQAPVTVLSCDNRMQNGDALGAAVKDFAKAAGLHITCDVRFPNAMVDRITPATTDDLRTQTGDPLAVPCEPFKEWVIEDNFAAARPNWPDVQWVKNVAPHEMRKLRMLNGAHSYLAYAGILAGHTYVHEAIVDPDLRAGAMALMQDAAATLPAEAQAQADTYAHALVTRFENPHLNHALRQIAMDGSQKLPYRMVDTLRACHEGDGAALVAGVRAWMAFCRSEIGAGRALQDPKAETLKNAQSDGDFLGIIGAADLMGRFTDHAG